MEHRAQTTIEIDGEEVPLRLTLGALAEIEDALDVGTLAELATRLANPSVGQLIEIVSVLAHAAAPDFDRSRIRDGSVSLKQALGAVALLFREVLTGQLPGKRSPEASAGEAG
jgi:hypothetical protein